MLGGGGTQMLNAPRRCQHNKTRPNSAGGGGGCGEFLPARFFFCLVAVCVAVCRRCRRCRKGDCSVGKGQNCGGWGEEWVGKGERTRDLTDTSRE